MQSFEKRDEHAVSHGLGSFGTPKKKKRDKEDGAVARKERKMEDGTRVQQDYEVPSNEDQSDQSESSAEGSQGKEDRPAGRQNPGAFEENSTMQVLLKIVQGMQSMQKH